MAKLKVDKETTEVGEAPIDVKVTVQEEIPAKTVVNEKPVEKLEEVKKEEASKESVEKPKEVEKEKEEDKTPEEPIENKAEETDAELDHNYLVKRILAMYPAYEELYIGAKGEIFVKESYNKKIHGVAKLYKNPNYKK